MTDSDPNFLFERDASWQERMELYVTTAREMSRLTDPQEMVQAYQKRMRGITAVDAYVSLSRRDLARPDVRVTRASIWGSGVNPWTAAEIVVHHGGLFSELIWKDQVTVIDELAIAEDDPAAPFCTGMRSLVAIPLFDAGEALNMVLLMLRAPRGFNREVLPERVMMSNLFGRATHNLVLRERVREAYDRLDHEMEVVANIQRSLLPSDLPQIPGVELAAHYRTSTRAGGDYYDFFPLPQGRVGILIADVSGHGTPAAVMMAITHSIAHTHHGPPAPPSALMNFVNRHLASRYTNGTGTFVTAFYGIYDPAARSIVYTLAGHCPPRLRRAGQVLSPFERSGLPLGIELDECYSDAEVTFQPNDVLALYTDGITEARGAEDELFGTDRLDAALGACPSLSAGCALDACLAELERFCSGRAPADDQTLLVASFT